jgi:hypothetical protein
MDCRAFVDRVDCYRVYGFVFRRTHEQVSLSNPSLSFRPECGSLRGVASLHQEMRAFCGLLFFEFSFVSGLASYTAFTLGPALGVALGYDCVLHVCPGGKPGRVASNFYPFANRPIQRCCVGQLRGFDGAGFDISFSDLETAQDECRRRLRSRARGSLSTGRRIL